MTWRGFHGYLAAVMLFAPAALAAQLPPAGRAPANRMPARQTMPPPRPPAAASQPVTAESVMVPIEMVGKAFDNVLLAAEKAEKFNTLAGNTQAMASYQKARDLANKWPALNVSADTRNRIAIKITELQRKVADQARQAQQAASQRRATVAIAPVTGGGGGGGGSSPGLFGGGMRGGGASGGGGGAARSGGGSACPPGAARSGST